jgi:hypothetical protein
MVGQTSCCRFTITRRSEEERGLRQLIRVAASESGGSGITWSDVAAAGVGAERQNRDAMGRTCPP